MAIEVPCLGASAISPTIDHSIVPVEQHADLDHIIGLLSLLARFELQFRAALALFDASDQEMWRTAREVEAGKQTWSKLNAVTDTTSAWQLMAARDGALAIYHFGNAIAGVRRSLPRCPAVNVAVDHNSLREASKIFRKTFPNYEAIRHVTGHVSDFSATPDRRKEHSHEGELSVGNISFDDSPRQFIGNLYNRSYVVSYKGRAYHYQINLNTAHALYLIKLRVFSSLMVKPSR